MVHSSLDVLLRLAGTLANAAIETLVNLGKPRELAHGSPVGHSQRNISSPRVVTHILPMGRPWITLESPMRHPWASHDFVVLVYGSAISRTWRIHEFMVLAHGSLDRLRVVHYLVVAHGPPMGHP